MDKKAQYWRILLTLQGILLLLMAIHSSIKSLGILGAYVVLLLLICSPMLLVLSAMQLFKKAKPIYKVAAAVGILASLAGSVAAGSLAYIYVTYLNK
ncbi:MAG TPA: hypothetical protein PK715_04885 [Chitinophagales bacterium]|nr:hypothetical protein [Chitinophagales bacterium]